MAARPTIKLDIEQIVPGQISKVEEPVTPANIVVNIGVALNSLDPGFIYTVEEIIFGNSKDSYEVTKSNNNSTDYPFVSYLFDGKDIGTSLILDFRYSKIDRVSITGIISNTTNILNNPAIEIIEINKDNTVKIVKQTIPNINSEYKINLDVDHNSIYRLRASMEYVG